MFSASICCVKWDITSSYL